MKLIVLNLPRDVSEEVLAEMFEPNGKVASCSIVTDDEPGVSMGFGFVSFRCFRISSMFCPATVRGQQCLASAGA